MTDETPLSKLLKQIPADFLPENIPAMHEHDQPYWERYLGGPLPDQNLLQPHWPQPLSQVAQAYEFDMFDHEQLIKIIWDDDPKAKAAVIQTLKTHWQRPGSRFFKIGYRTTKDTFCVVAKDAEELVYLMAQSERAMEEVSMAKARNEQIMITTRKAIDSPSIDRTELRVLIRENKIMRVSTGPYEFHTLAMAQQLYEQARPTLEHIAQWMHVPDVWCDVFFHDGCWWLCDINPNLPTTWPGHSWYLKDNDPGDGYLACSLPNAEGKYHHDIGTAPLDN